MSDLGGRPAEGADGEAQAPRDPGAQSPPPRYPGAPASPPPAAPQAVLPPLPPGPPGAPPTVGWGPGGGGPSARPDRGRAAVVGVLNLSGLGLGYVALRHWWSALLCWLATGGLVFALLPADPDGVPVGPVAAYAVWLLLVAVDGARRGLRTPLPARFPGARLALPLALLLLAVPLAGGYAYGAAQEEARQQRLLDRLAEADAQVQRAERQGAFASAESTYRKALRAYAELGAEHPGSRAAELVPERLDAYYKTVSAPYTRHQYCEAVAPLKHLREVPGVVEEDLLGELATWPDEPLARSLRECGMDGLGGRTTNKDAGAQLKELLTTFPESPHARAIEDAVRERIDSRAGRLTGASPCPAHDELSRIADVVETLPAATSRALRGDADGAVRDGLYACGLDRFKDKQFSSARRSMDRFAKDHASDPRTAQAKRVAIAAEIAAKRPAAGRKLPPERISTSARQTLEFRNIGPAKVEILYTGPVTGKASVKACAGCKTYASPEAGRAACRSSSASSGPSTTLRLPPGEYHFLYKYERTSITSRGYVRTYDSGAQLKSGYRYTDCLFIFSRLGSPLDNAVG